MSECPTCGVRMMKCADCGTDIPKVGSSQIRCRPCQRRHNNRQNELRRRRRMAEDPEYRAKRRERDRQRKIRRRARKTKPPPPPPAMCVECGTEIPARRSRCEPCQRRRHNERQKVRYHERMAEDPEFSQRRNSQKRERRRRLGGEREARRSAQLVGERDGWSCAYCGTDLDPEDGATWHVDHYWPAKHADGYPGEDINELVNLRLACPPCNMAKHAKLPKEWEARPMVGR